MEMEQQGHTAVPPAAPGTMHSLARIMHRFSSRSAEGAALTALCFTSLR